MLMLSNVLLLVSKIHTGARLVLHSFNTCSNCNACASTDVPDGLRRGKRGLVSDTHVQHCSALLKAGQS